MPRDEFWEEEVVGGRRVQLSESAENALSTRERASRFIFVWGIFVGFKIVKLLFTKKNLLL